MRHRLISLVLLAAALLAARAGAQPSQTDKGLAQSLFEQGKALMDGGSYEQACPKLEESQRLDPGGGTLLNLALCHEKQGRVATAWSEFKEALSAAKRDARQERITAAEEHIKALEPKLPWLTLTVDGAVEGQEVKLDGASVGRAGWGTPVAIDPGGHELKATAPGRKEWSIGFRIAAGEKRTLSVPLLEVDPNAGVALVAPPPPPATAPAPAPVPPPAHDGERRTGGSPTIGWVIGGAGVAALGVGSYFGIRTLSKKKESDELCPTDTTCSDQGVKLNDQAKASAWIANISIGLGLVGVGVGTYIIVTAGNDGESTTGGPPRRGMVALGVTATPGASELVLSGTW